jgi:hypothetical protein
MEDTMTTQEKLAQKVTAEFEEYWNYTLTRSKEEIFGGGERNCFYTVMRNYFTDFSCSCPLDKKECEELLDHDNILASLWDDYFCSPNSMFADASEPRNYIRSYLEWKKW